jgi:hypothetical protein
MFNVCEKYEVYGSLLKSRWRAAIVIFCQSSIGTLVLIHHAVLVDYNFLDK